MSERRDAKRLAKRFGFTFVLVGVAVGSASLIGRDDVKRDSSPPPPADSTVGVTTPASSPTSEQTLPTATVVADVSTTGPDESSSAGRLPAPDLQAFCFSHYPGSIVNDLNIESTFSCRTTYGGEGHDADVDEVCVEQYGRNSRQVVFSLTPVELRCVPAQPVEIGTPDFSAYCRTVFGVDSTASLIDSSARGWRCGTIVNGMFETGDIDFDGHRVDLACQLPIGVEGYAVMVNESTSDGWRCYGLP